MDIRELSTAAHAAVSKLYDAMEHPDTGLRRVNYVLQNKVTFLEQRVASLTGQLNDAHEAYYQRNDDYCLAKADIAHQNGLLEDLTHKLAELQAKPPNTDFSASCAAAKDLVEAQRILGRLHDEYAITSVPTTGNLAGDVLALAAAVEASSARQAEHSRIERILLLEKLQSELEHVRKGLCK